MAETNFQKPKRWLACCLSLVVMAGLAACDPEGSSNSGKTLSTDTPEAQRPSPKRETSQVVVFFGNSITAGYELNPDDAFPAILQRRLDSLGMAHVRVVNAGVSGETSADGLGRIAWTLKQPVNVFVLELGGNDGLRGLALEETRTNLDSILTIVRRTYPDVQLVVAGMEIPPNMGPQYTRQFREMYPYLATKHQATLIPFLLEAVAAEPHLNLDDGIHPNEEGHLLVAETVWTYLSPLLGAAE